MFKRIAPALVTASLLFGASAAQAQAVKDDNGCVGPFPESSALIVSVCDILPFLCTAHPPVFSTLGDALIDMSQTMRLVQSASISANAGRIRIRDTARAALDSLHVPAALRDQALSAINAANSANLPHVAGHTMSVGAAMGQISGPFMGAGSSGDDAQTYADSGGGTVTTTTSGGWEINLGIFKIFETQTVTTVEETDQADDSGYTEECDEDGNCVCIEE